MLLFTKRNPGTFFKNGAYRRAIYSHFICQMPNHLHFFEGSTALRHSGAAQVKLLFDFIGPRWDLLHPGALQVKLLFDLIGTRWDLWHPGALQVKKLLDFIGLRWDLWQPMTLQACISGSNFVKNISYDGMLWIYSNFRVLRLPDHWWGLCLLTPVADFRMSSVLPDEVEVFSLG